MTLPVTFIVRIPFLVFLSYFFFVTENPASFVIFIRRYEKNTLGENMILEKHSYV